MSGCQHCGAAHPDGAKNCPRTGHSMALPGPCGGTIDRYVVERLIAAGGMGEVYRARHVSVQQPVALKLLRRELADDPEVLGRFTREARAAGAIGNAHIVGVRDFGVAADGRAFMAMELLEGADLEALFEREGTLPVARAVAIVLQVLDALAAAHAAGVVHRDVKPANVFLVARPGAPDDFVKLLDFGISRMRVAGVASLTHSGSMLGTPCYMAPEQFRGARETGPASDLFSAAVMLYRALAGELPFAGDTYASLMQSVCTGTPRPLAARAPSLPPALVAAIERGLAREPADRFVDAPSFAAALRASIARPAATPAPVLDDRAFSATAYAAPPPTERAVAPSYRAPAPWPVATPPAPTPPPYAMPAPLPPPAYPPYPAPHVAAPAPARTRTIVLAALVGAGVVVLLLGALAAGWWFLLREHADEAHVATVAPPAPTAPAVVPVNKPDASAASDDDDDDTDPTALAQLQAINPGLPYAATPEPGAAVIAPPQLVGLLNRANVRRVLASAQASMASCARPGQVDRVGLTWMVGNGGTEMVQPSVTAGSTDATVAQCLADRLTSAADGAAHLGDGIVQLGIAVRGR